MADKTYLIVWHSGKMHASIIQEHASQIVGETRNYAIDEINNVVHIDASGNSKLAKFDSDIKLKAIKFYKGV